MAHVPSNDEIREHQAQAAREENDKFREQQAQNKGFVNHGQGVIPEDVWTTLPGKKIDNEEDIE